MTRPWVAGYPQWNAYGQQAWPAPAYGGCVDRLLPRMFPLEGAWCLTCAQGNRYTQGAPAPASAPAAAPAGAVSQASGPLVKSRLPSAQLTVHRCTQAMARPSCSPPRQLGRRRGREPRRHSRSPSPGLRRRSSCRAPGLLHRRRPGRAWRAAAAAPLPRQRPAGPPRGRRPRALSSGRRWGSASSRTHLRRRT